ncbi:4688_t:CDS:2, partial [Acaulospora colombiana]
ICKHLRNVIDGSIELQLRITLVIDGWLLAYRGTGPSKDIIDYQKRRREHMEQMNYSDSWTSKSEITGQFEVCDGILAESVDINEERRTFRSVRYQEIVSPRQKNNPWKKEWEDLGMEITDFSFWAHADLQMLMEPRDDNTTRRIHFRTISTNAIHPEAKSPYLDLYQSDCPVWEKCNTVAFEDRVVFHFTDTQDDVRRAAGLVLDCFEGVISMDYMPIADLAFLSRDEVLLLFNGEDEEDKVTLGVYSVPLKRIVCRCRFPFAYLPYIAFFLTRPESRFGEKCPSSMAKMVMPDPIVNILGISFHLKPGDRSYCCVVLSVDAFTRTYQSLLEKYPDREVFDWEEWGPSTTRWLPYYDINHAGNPNIFGSRMLTWGRANAIDPRSYDDLNLLLLDFNPRPIRKGAVTTIEERYHVLVVDQETLWVDPHGQFTVTSSLPYRAFVTSWLPRHSYFRFDGSTIMGRGYKEYGFYSFLPLQDDATDKIDEALEDINLSAY